MVIINQLQGLYSRREYQLMSRDEYLAIGNAAHEISQGWGQVRKGNINHGLTVGCGGEATQVINLLNNRCSAATKEHFSICRLSGYGTALGATAHVVTLILPYYNVLQHRKKNSSTRSTAFASNWGLVLDTWWYNAGFSKRVYSLASFKSDYGRNLNWSSYSG